MANVQEYICISCWTAFTVPADEHPEQIRCPKCGNVLPGTDALSAATVVVQPSPPETPTAPAPPVEPAVRDLPRGPSEPPRVPDLAPPRAPDPAPPPLASRPSEPRSRPPSPGASPGAAGAGDAMWQLKSESGLKYNFHGVDALQKWAANVSHDRVLLVSLDGVEWKLYWDFERLLKQTRDAGIAYRGARVADEGSPPTREEARPSEKAASAVEAPPSAGPPPPEAPRRTTGPYAERPGGPAKSVLNAERSGGPPKATPMPSAPPLTTPPGAPAPGVRREQPVTGPFQFRVAQPAVPSWKDRLVFLGLGAVLGAAAVLLLRFLGFL